MTVREMMTREVVWVEPDAPVSVAARALEHYNIGALPVCGRDGSLRGVVTDRDLVTRCLAAGKRSRDTTVADVMTKRVEWIGPESESAAAAEKMARAQVRRLPVVENGKVCGMVSLGDLAAREEMRNEAEKALEEISKGLSRR